MSALREKEVWFKNKINSSWKSSESKVTLFNNVHSLIILNLHLYQELSERNTTPTVNQKQYEVKRDNWTLKSSFKSGVTADSSYTWFSNVKLNLHLNKERKIAFRVAEIKQKKNNLMNEHYTALCITSDHTVEWESRMQEVNQRSETSTLNFFKKFYDDLFSIADLKNDEFKVLSESVAEVNSSGQKRQFKRSQMMCQLWFKNPNMTVSYSWKMNELHIHW